MGLRSTCCQTYPCALPMETARAICSWASLPNPARTRDVNQQHLPGEITLAIPSPATPGTEPHLVYWLRKQGGRLGVAVMRVGEH